MILTLSGNGKLTVAGLFAVLAILAIGFAGCGSSGSNKVAVVSEPAPVSTPEPTAAPVGETPAVPEETPVAPEETPVAPEETTDPVEDPEGPGLVWTEIDLAGALSADERSTISLESVGDGRVLALSYSDRGSDSILVTENGTDWTPIQVPAGFLPWSVDITGDRWLIQGWDSTLEPPSTQIRFSDDEGESWTEIVVDLASFDGTAWIAEAIVSGELIVVVALSDGVPPDIDQALEEDIEYESSVHLFLSDGGPAEPVTEFPGWFSGGYGATDGFHLILSGNEEDYLLTSPDGREWTRTPVGVEITDSARNEFWTADEGYTDYRIERFEGVYGSGQVLTLPEGIGWMPDLAVGPAGVAAVGGLASPYDASGGEFTMPDISFEKDGYELRYNQPEGGITLWDLEDDSAVYVFDAETLQREEPPEVVQEVEGEDGSELVIFLDPETGAELVAFSGEELAEAVMEAAMKQEESDAYEAYNPNKFLIGWSVDGIDWKWQTLQEAFALPESTQDDNSFTEVEVAVGGDFVLAKVQTHEFPEADFGDDFEVGIGDGQPDSTSAYLTAPNSPSPPRWFIARIG